MGPEGGPEGGPEEGPEVVKKGSIWGPAGVQIGGSKFCTNPKPCIYFVFKSRQI